MIDATQDNLKESGIKIPATPVPEQISPFMGSNIEPYNHAGADSVKVQFKNIRNRRFFIHHTLIGSLAADANNYNEFFVAPFDCIVTSFREIHYSKGTDPGTVTLQLGKLTGVQILDNALSLLSAAVDLKGTSHVVIDFPNASNSRFLVKSISTNQPYVQLKKGDRLALLLSGTPTAVANVTTVTEIMY